MKVVWVFSSDFGGWRNAGIDQILALDAVGVDVVPRWISYDGFRADLPDRIRTLAEKSASGSDVVVQNVLPSSYEYDGNFRKNIGSYFVETSNFRSSDWVRHINLMDQAWVPCQHNLDASRASGVVKQLRVVPQACDMSKYERSYSPHKVRDELRDSFIFYFIGECIPRKNIQALVRAFHLEFDPSEPVELLLKTSIRGLSPDVSRAKIQEDLARIKKSLNLYADEARYKRELVVTERLDEEGIMRLHASCDCFVSASHGEGWNLGAFEAMAMGKTPIVPAHSAHFEYICASTGYLVSGKTEPVTDMSHVHNELYTARQNWFSVDIDDLRAAMREAYSRPDLRTARSEQGMLRAYDFSYETVGGLMKGMLEQ